MMGGKKKILKGKEKEGRGRIKKIIRPFVSYSINIVIFVKATVNRRELKKGGGKKRARDLPTLVIFCILRRG